VDLAIAPSAPFVDIASLLPLCKLTGGELTYVPEFGGFGASDSAGSAAERLAKAVTKALCSRPAGSDAVFRVRASPGLAATRIAAAAGKDDVNVVNLPTIHDHTTFAVELAHESSPSVSSSSSTSSILKGERAFIQSALLFTAPDGTRRIRVLTRPLRVVHDASALLRAAHPPTLAALLAKFACDDISRTSTKQVAESVQASCASALLAMREFCPPPLKRLSEEIILTRPLELLPLLTLALLKIPPLLSPNGGTYSPDAAAVCALRALTLPAHLLCLMLVPRVRMLHLRSEGDSWIPSEVDSAPPSHIDGASDAGANAVSGDEGGSTPRAAPPGLPSMPAAREITMLRGVEVSASGVYLLDGLLEQVLWVGHHASPTFLKALFGTERPGDGAPLQPAGASTDAAKLHALLDAAAAERPFNAPLRVVAQGSPMQSQFFSRLAADGYEQFVMSQHATRVQPKL